MHPVTTMKHWSHHLHDGMMNAMHHIDEHLHSRHFWAGVGITLLIIGFITMFFMFARNAPVHMPMEFRYGLPYTPYLP